MVDGNGSGGGSRAKGLVFFLAGFLVFALTIVVVLSNALMTTKGGAFVTTAALNSCQDVDLFKHTLRWSIAAAIAAMVAAFVVYLFYDVINGNSYTFPEGVFRRSTYTLARSVMYTLIYTPFLALLGCMVVIAAPFFDVQWCFY